MGDEIPDYLYAHIFSSINDERFNGYVIEFIELLNLIKIFHEYNRQKTQEEINNMGLLYVG